MQNRNGGKRIITFIEGKLNTFNDGSKIITTGACNF